MHNPHMRTVLIARHIRMVICPPSHRVTFHAIAWTCATIREQRIERRSFEPAFERDISSLIGSEIYRLSLEVKHD
jgi:hypothetical protein